MNTVLPSILRPNTTCCDAPPPPAVVPLPISNPPGQPAIAYRIGTFTSFRRAMLDRLSQLIDDDPTNPFANWHEGTTGDYQSVFIELWAYLADILTFYQERIANEAYLRTATQLDSLLRLVALINYRPSPGAGAVCLEAFVLDNAKSVMIPAGFRTGNKPAPGAASAVFETSAAIQAYGPQSAMPMAGQVPVDQFAQYYGQTGPTDYTIILVGAATGLSAGSFILLVDGSGQNLRQLTSVSADPTSKTTTITWTENGPGFQDPTICALQTAAAPFGNNAPMYAALPLSLRQVTSPPTPGGIPYPIDWDDPTQAACYLPLTADPTLLFLDSVQSQLAVTPDNQGFVVLLSDQTVSPNTGTSSIGSAMYQVFQFTDARAVSLAVLAMSGRTTRLKLGAPIPSMTFPLRSTTILTGAVPLTLATSVPASTTVWGQQLTLAGAYSTLQTGQTAILQGPLANPWTGLPTGGVQAEAVVIGLIAPIDTTNNLTTVTLQAPLAGTYVTAQTVLMGNVAIATQGETVPNEILGSGDGSAFQSFPLAKSPLTYLPTSQADGSAAVESTLRVIVNGLLWEEEPSLVGSAADAQVFATQTDSSGTTTVLFGDGFQAARPSSGLDNVRARYRRGIGTSGNLPPGAIVQLIDSIPGVKSVTNPLPSSGGADPARLDQIQSLAPFTVGSISRAVSVADFAVLALGYPGVSKASAAWIANGSDGVQVQSAVASTLPQAHIRLTLATSDQVPLGQQPAFTRGLRVYLDQRRDPNVPLRLGDYTPAYIAVAATIDVEDRFPRLATLASVQAALWPGLNANGAPGFFAFDRLQFGQGLALATLYATIQAIPGVRDATITTFCRLDPSPPPPNTVLKAITLAPTELITIINDPNNPSTGTITITLGEGGFIDS